MTWTWTWNWTDHSDKAGGVRLVAQGPAGVVTITAEPEWQEAIGNTKSGGFNFAHAHLSYRRIGDTSKYGQTHRTWLVRNGKLLGASAAVVLGEAVEQLKRLAAELYGRDVLPATPGPIVAYDVVTGYMPGSFLADVQAKREDGWEPLGGVAAVTGGGTPYLAQAFVKRGPAVPVPAGVGDE